MPDAFDIRRIDVNDDISIYVPVTPTADSAAPSDDRATARPEGPARRPRAGRGACVRSPRAHRAHAGRRAGGGSAVCPRCPCSHRPRGAPPAQSDPASRAGGRARVAARFLPGTFPRVADGVRRSGDLPAASLTVPSRRDGDGRRQARRAAGRGTRRARRDRSRGRLARGVACGARARDPRCDPSAAPRSPLALSLPSALPSCYSDETWISRSRRRGCGRSWPPPGGSRRRACGRGSRGGT